MNIKDYDEEIVDNIGDKSGDEKELKKVLLEGIEENWEPFEKGEGNEELIEDDQETIISDEQELGDDWEPLEIDEHHDLIYELKEANLENKKKINEDKIKLDNDDLKKTWEELRNIGLTLKQIREKIGVDIRGTLYRGNRINKKSLKKLENLIGREICRAEKIEILEEKDRIYIEPSLVTEICSELNQRGISNNKISKNIGTYIGNTLYHGYTLNQDSFEKLEELYGYRIPNKIIEPKEKINKPLKLKKNEDLAELICIILGDGHLHKKGEKKYKNSLLSISLNRVDELEYVFYVRNLMQKVFKISPDLVPRKNSKSVDIKLYGDGLIETLKRLGLMTGDKIQNQVCVPQWFKKDQEWIECNKEEWIFKYRPLLIRGLKGLVDTDGTIYVDKKNKSLGIGFRNASLPLIRDFKEMCRSLGISCGKITISKTISKKTGRLLKGYQTLIRAKDDVKNFIITIEPMKWKIKKVHIRETMKKLGSSVDEALMKKESN